MKKYYYLTVLMTTAVLSGCTKKEAAVAPVSETAEITETKEPEIEVTDETDVADVSVLQEYSATETPSGTSSDAFHIASPEDMAENSSIRVVCFGHSLVYGTGGGGVTLSDVIHRYSGANAMNYGGYDEDTNVIAARSGANKLTITEDFTIPSDNTPVEIAFESEFGQVDKILMYSDGGLNPVTISAVNGELSRKKDDEDNVHYYFERTNEGSETHVGAGTLIEPDCVSRMEANDITVIWTSGNDNPQNTEDIEAIIEKIDKMIAFSGNDRYIILSNNSALEELPLADEINALFEEHYGEHFVNLRKYFMTDASKDLGYPLSEEDLQNISDGEIPQCFRSDMVHGNSLYYLAAGQQVYRKCRELGYLK